MTLILGVFDYAPIGQPDGFCTMYVDADTICGQPYELSHPEFDLGICDPHLREQEAREWEAEHDAEMAVERYYEGGWDTLGVYDDERWI